MGSSSRIPNDDAVAWYNKGLLYGKQGDAVNAMKCKDKARDLGFHAD